MPIIFFAMVEQLMTVTSIACYNIIERNLRSRCKKLIVTESTLDKRGQSPLIANKRLRAKARFGGHQPTAPHRHGAVGASPRKRAQARED